GTCKQLSEQALHHLVLRSWPGNVRELQHVVKRHYIMGDDAAAVEIAMELEQPLYRRSSDRLSHGIERPESPSNATDRETIRFGIGTPLEDVERTVLLETLVHCHYDKRLAARMLGVSRKTVYNMLKRYRSRGLIGDDLSRNSE
ncbi:MAG: helix-turn-helix domain-containing protein, partial [Gammaproteobacteria bacterium]